MTLKDRIWLGLFAGVAMAAVGSAQQVQVGNLPDSPNFGVPVPVGGRVLDMWVGAPQAAVLTTATFAYSNFPCPAAVSIQFGRLPMRLSESFAIFDSRGPFDVEQTRQTVALSPPVSVLQGDYISITRLTGCGYPLGEQPFPGSLIVFPQGALIGGTTIALAAFGTATPFNGIASIIPVVYTGDGAAGSHFRTVVQLHNPTGDPISGDLGYLGPTYSSAHEYSLGPYEVKSLDSFFPVVGSFDILPRIGRTPIAVARLFNDLGSSGTVGFTEPETTPAEALGSGDRGVLFGPVDEVNFRLNIGYRSISPTATITVTARRNDGTTAASASLSAGPSLTQVPFEWLLGLPLEPNMTITFEAKSGNVLIYGVTADNRTNDTSFQLARRVGS